MATAIHWQWSARTLTNKSFAVALMRWTPPAFLSACHPIYMLVIAIWTRYGHPVLSVMLSHSEVWWGFFDWWTLGSLCLHAEQVWQVPESSAGRLPMGKKNLRLKTNNKSTGEAQPANYLNKFIHGDKFISTTPASNDIAAIEIRQRHTGYAWWTCAMGKYTSRPSVDNTNFSPSCIDACYGADKRDKDTEMTYNSLYRGLELQFTR
jgi:hypothetical protein